MGDEAVSSIVGSILLVGITVAAFAALSVAVLSFEGPQDQDRAMVHYKLGPGSGGWGDGDETLIVRHLGGEPLETSDVRVIFRTGAGEETLTAAALGMGETFRTGDFWLRSDLTVAIDDQLDVLFIQDSSERVQSSATLSSTSPTSGLTQPGGGGGPLDPCVADASPPEVNLWTQTPSDVDTSHTGVVTVRARAVDDCAGVDSTITPTLQWRINDGTAPAWNDVAMALQSPGIWQADIPSQVYALYALQDLEYRIGPLADNNGNTLAFTGIQQDEIHIPEDEDPGFAYHDLDCNGRFDGSDTNEDANLQSGDYDVDYDFCLVIPASHGPITANEIDIHARSITIGVDLTSTGDRIHLKSDNGDVRIADGVTVDADQKLDIDVGNGDFVAPGATLIARGGDLTIDAKDGNIDVAGATLRTTGEDDKIELDTKGEMDLQGASFQVDEGGQIRLKGATGQQILVGGAAFTEEGSGTCAKVTPSTALIVGSPAQGSASKDCDDD